MELGASITVAIASLLLNLLGIPTTSAGEYLYLNSIQQSLQIQIGLLDWVNVLLLDFFYVFAIWTYVTVKTRHLGSRTYAGLGTIGAIVIFLGNAIRVSAQVYLGVVSGALAKGYDTATAASLDTVGFMVIFGIVLLTAGCTCLAVARKTSTPKRGWPHPSLNPPTL